ncbi:GNAT family N-acetyltransferase [Gulosibacter sediminis]|uniref:GNAT family N-acetyltransferase n=1 Tax=Gulosibacter sediminis TaxID=1729695 RepID=UPI0024ACC0A6|nr:GNAT family N-acetyltransferase [Gulosibacter sediminis]
MTNLDAATAAMNDWRIHAFAELAPYTRPEGERMHAAGSLVGVASEVRPDPGASWSIFNPPVVDELVVRGADTSGEDPEAPAGGDLAALLDAWATGAPTGVPLQLELPVALRGAPAVLAARGFTPVSTFAVRRVEGEPRPSAWASKPGRKLREVTAEDRAGVAGLLEELHAADADAATGAWAHPQLREHLLDYAGRVVDVPVLAVIAEYFGLVAGVANFAAPGTVAPRTSRERELYVQFTAVTRRLRAGGVGAALVGELDARARAAGAELLAVDFGALNPESAPFWLRQGFRPLTTMWRRR